jgi:hypothetical protein
VVAEAILALAFALSKNMFRLGRMTRAGKWRDSLEELTGDIRNPGALQAALHGG